MSEIYVKGYDPSSFNEWPGKITAIIFMSGCNFKCGFCHNKGLVENSPELPNIKFSDVLEHLKSRKKWIDAVEITGGEPSIHRKEVVEILKKVKEKGFLTKIDTNGFDPQFISELNKLKLVDYWAMDVKASLSKYSDVAGVDVGAEDIRKSIKLIMDSAVDYEFRTTVVPSLHDNSEMLEIAREIKDAKRYFIQNFAPNNTLDPSFMDIQPFSDVEMEGFAETARPYVREVRIR